MKDDSNELHLAAIGKGELCEKGKGSFGVTMTTKADDVRIA